MARTDFPYWRYWTQGGRKRSRGKKEEGGVHFPLPPHSRPCHADRNTVHRADRVVQQAVVSPPLLPAVGVRQRKIFSLAGKLCTVGKEEADTKVFTPRPRALLHNKEEEGGKWDRIGGGGEERRDPRAQSISRSIVGRATHVALFLIRT